MKYSIKTLGQLTSFISKGIAPRYARFDDNNVIRVLNQRCNRNNEISLANSRLNNLSKRKVPSEKILKDNDVLINSTGVGTAGRVAQIRKVNKSLTVDGHMIIMRPIKDIDPVFYGYAIIANQYKIEQLAEGSTGQTEINRQRLLNEITLKVPSVEEQKRLADDLLNIDYKIKVNKQINANFTDQIKTISNSLFSYFEAFNGKMPGDWHYEKLTDIANIDTGYSYKGNELKPSSTAMATIKNFNRKGGFNIEGFKEIRPNKDIKSEKYAKRFDILVAHTDLTQNADIIGNAEPILDISNYTNVIYSMDLVKVTTKDNRISQFLLSLILQGEALKAHCLGYINGTTVLHLSKKALKQFEIPLPNDLHDLDNIDKFARKAYLIMGNNLVENRYLQSIKNELLEKYF